MDANRLSLSVLPVIYVVAYTFLSRFSVESTSHLPGGAQRKGKVSSFFQCLFFGHLRSHPDSRSLFIGVAVRVYLKIKKFISCCRRRLQKALVLSCHHVSRPLFQKGFSHTTERERERERLKFVCRCALCPSFAAAAKEEAFPNLPAPPAQTGC